MPETYTHRTEDQRYQSDEGFVCSRSYRVIAKSSSTVITPAYPGKLTAIKTNESTKTNQLTDEIKVLIAQSIKKDWSPDQVQGRLRGEGYTMVGATIIYAFIQRDKVAVGDLHQHPLLRKFYTRKQGL